MNRPLTNQQQAVYDFIREKITGRGYGPTVREIGEHMNIKSPNGVMCHLRALERKGMLTRTANKSRAIELTEPVSQLMGGSLPIVGRIVGGVSTRFQESKQSFELRELISPERYVLEVRDDSLLDANIQPGDGLIIQKQDVAAAGQLALIVSAEKESSLRYYWPEDGRIRLESPNRSQSPTLSEQAKVEGVVVGLVRIFRERRPPDERPVNLL